MANNLVIYMVVHQPRRIRLPARIIPRGTPAEALDAYLFDEEMDRRYFEKVARYCYRPATAMFQELVEAGMKIAIGLSVSLLFQMRRWGRDVLSAFQTLLAHPNVELVAVEPYHSFLFYLDIERFMERMRWGRDHLSETFQKPIVVTDTTEMFMSNEVYFALQGLGFQAAVMDGRPWVLGWRAANYLYRYPGQTMRLLARHHELSDDVGYRFSNRGWSQYPLTADRYAHWLRQVQGDFTFLAWDFETFGEHHREDSGIFPFMRALHADLRQHGMRYHLPSEALTRFPKVHEIPLPEYGCTWAGDGGMDFFLGNPAQQGLFRLMHHVYSKAQLTMHPHLLDLALWLLQSDNLHLIQWFHKEGSEAEVSAYFTPDEWWELGPLGILREQQRVYVNFLRAMDEYVR
jgi:alpha-amylase